MLHQLHPSHSPSRRSCCCTLAASSLAKETTTSGNKTNSDANMDNITYIYIYMYIIMYVYKDISWLWLRDSYTKSKSPKKSLVYWNLAMKTWWMFHSSNWRILPIYWFPPPGALCSLRRVSRSSWNFSSFLSWPFTPARGVFLKAQKKKKQGCVSLS